MSEYHVPVLLRESVDALITDKNGIYVDVTFGGGGHSRAILAGLDADGELFGFDQDLETLNNVPEDERFTFVRSNFCYLQNFLDYYGVEQIDGLLADLGVSSHHFDKADRGFSFRFDARLDMRMNQEQDLSAYQIINTYDAESLANIFYFYGELKQSRRLASLIIDARSERKIETIAQLIECVKPAINPKNEKKELAQLFQAIRIEVNDEMEVLKQMLRQAASVVKPGGKIVVITYHSLEDRLVKNFLKSGNFEGVIEKDFYGKPLTPFNVSKIIIPSDDEIESNPRSRSAKLRIATVI